MSRRVIALFALWALWSGSCSPTVFAAPGKYRPVGSRLGDYRYSRRTRKSLRYAVPRHEGSISLVDKKRRRMLEVVHDGKKVTLFEHAVDWVGHQKDVAKREREFSSESAAAAHVSEFVTSRKKAGYPGRRA
jgi:hypothetical protein